MQRTPRMTKFTLKGPQEELERGALLGDGEGVPLSLREGGEQQQRIQVRSGTWCPACPVCTSAVGSIQEPVG